MSTIRGEVRTPEELVAFPLDKYLVTRKYLLEPHRHSFYLLVYITKGSGRQYLDFENYPVHSGEIYFMIPGQVHHWSISEKVQGYVVNFADKFFDILVNAPQYLEQYPFFSGHHEEQVIQLPKKVQPQIVDLFEKILDEQQGMKAHALDMIRIYLMQLFVLVSRNQPAGRLGRAPQHNVVICSNFRKLVEENFLQKKLPMEYAEMLYVTPNYLNSLCKDVLGKPAGQIIRERIILEAKRLLVNADQTISEIAYQLNFQDNSYFSKFFKKYAGTTPEEFRKQYHIVSPNQ